MRLSEADLVAAVDRILTADPEILVVGMSSLIVWDGYDASCKRKAMLEQRSKLPVTGGSFAVAEALNKFGAKTIGIISPYMPIANKHISQFFTDIGFKVKNFIPFLIVGIFLWDFTHQSGVHATIAGVLLALTIPHNIKNNKNSMLLKLEHSLSPYVAFGIMPLFAFANAGVSLEGLTFATLLNPVPLGIVLGLFFGKQIGVFLLSYISVKLKLADMPSNATWPAFYAVSILTGIGFTMSLFVGNLAFANDLEYMDGVKIGVLTGSLLSTLFGYFLLLFFSKK